MLFRDGVLAFAQDAVDEVADVDIGNRRDLGVESRVVQQVLDQPIEVRRRRADLRHAELSALAEAVPVLPRELDRVAGDAA